ncbi:flagellar hook-basal body complex protein FliE [Desulfococcus sp.]|uniref:flagellar hook-basal body complex protein FliE n=1 Tax=Desulfococcus sp. TaxID=2025834 RepID=UPI003594760A
MKEIAFPTEMVTEYSGIPQDRPAGSDRAFKGVLEETLGEVDRFQKEKDTAVRNLATGRDADIHNTMIAIQKAHISFKFLIQVRNKIVSAYEEVMRMNV